MSTSGWVIGSVRRAVSTVMSVLPGHGTSEEEPAPGGVARTEESAAGATPAPAGQVAGRVAPTATAPRRAKASAGSATNAAPNAAPNAASDAARKAAPKAAATRPSRAAAPTATAESVPSAPVASPWTAEELAGFRAALEQDIVRLREELNMGEADMAELIADSGDGAGDDQADAGSKTLEREQEMSVNANARELLDQSTHAMVRLRAGTYGICEGCGSVIPAPRLRAFPRATRCIACKQAEERR